MTIFDEEGQPEWDNNDYSRDFEWLGQRRDTMMKTYDTSRMIGQIENNFTYHSPKDDQNERYILLRNSAKNLAINILERTPQSREQSLALTKLEESIFWANAAIARNE